jgi:hypothetical protein
VILFRCFPWDREAGDRARGGPLWFARMLRGDGRHDAPILYGCLYVSVEPVSTVVEQLARFAGTELSGAELVRRGRPLALAAVELSDASEVIDLDDPPVLAAEGLRPSVVATGERARTQAYAAELYERHPQAAGIRWWSTFESQWPNVTLFDRAAEAITVEDVRTLSLADDVVADAARFLGLPVAA